MEEEEQENRAINSIIDREKFCYFFDSMLRNTHRWNAYLIWAVFQCIIVIAFIITSIANLTGIVLYRSIVNTLEYFSFNNETKQIHNITSECSSTYWNMGSSVLSIILIVISYITAKIYVYIKDGRYFNTGIRNDYINLNDIQINR